MTSNKKNDIISTEVERKIRERRTRGQTTKGSSTADGTDDMGGIPVIVLNQNLQAKSNS